MRLLCWNVFNENAEASRIGSCLDIHTPDIALLQELTPIHLNQVRDRFGYVETARDYALKGEMCFLAIASHYPLTDLRVITHFPDSKPPGSPLARSMGWVEFLDTLSAVVVMPEGGHVRVCVLHTSAGVRPTLRMQEMDAVAPHLSDSAPCVVGGDFNSFSEPWMAPFVALLFAYRAEDFWLRERRRLEAWFHGHGFIPTIRGVTFPKLRLQMDQVFIRDLTLGQAKIYPNTFGSDHRPIVVELSTLIV